MNVLIIDDEHQLIELFEGFSDNCGSTIMGANNHADAINLLSKHSFDIIICDLHMPDGNGIDFFTEHKGLFGDSKFFLLTGDTAFTPPEGITHVYKKPEDIKLIISLITE
jgi:two-component system NtrC family response regulator